MKQSVFDLEVNGITMGVHQWLPEGDAVGVLQISHGMAEHGGRYAEFARALTDAGWVVFASDHRGHGRTAAASKGPKGHFADQGGWNLAVEDLRTVSLHVLAQHRGKPHVLFGHSMGSLLARDYAQRYGRDLAGLILSGTPAPRGLIGKGGKALAQYMVKLRGPRSEGKLMDRLSFGSYNAAFKPTRTDFDWLSRDAAAVDAYVADPDCGFVCTNRFYVDLLEGLERVNDPKRVKSWPHKKLPVLVVSGAVDPAGGPRAVKALKHLLKSAGVKQVSATTYAGDRHELLNELDRDQVVRDILQWLDKHVEVD